MTECVNCGELREIVAEDLCFTCFRKVKSTEPEAPGDMADEELGEFIAQKANEIADRSQLLRPYYFEIRQRFAMRESRTETIYGFKNWGEFCEKVLGRTKRNINYLIAGGNKNRPKRQVGNAFPTTEPNGDQGDGDDTVNTNDEYICSCGAKWSNEKTRCPECGLENIVAQRRLARKVSADLLTWMYERPADRATIREAAPGMDEESIEYIEQGFRDQRAYADMVETEILQKRLPLEVYSKKATALGSGQAGRGGTEVGPSFSQG